MFFSEPGLQVRGKLRKFTAGLTPDNDELGEVISVATNTSADGMPTSLFGTVASEFAEVGSDLLSADDMPHEIKALLLTADSMPCDWSVSVAATSEFTEVRTTFSSLPPVDDMPRELKAPLLTADNMP